MKLKDNIGGTAQAFVEHIAYNSKGQRILAAYANGLMTRYAYDAQTFLLKRQRTESYTQSGWQFASNGNVKQDTAYTYDNNGNILSINENTTNCGVGGANSLLKEFTYDPIYRLLSATGRENSPTISPIWDDSYRSADSTTTSAYTQNYQYDKIGNIQQLQHIGTNNFTRTFNYNTAHNKLASIDVGSTNYAYTYDANGNQLTQSSSRHLIWDYADRLKSFYVEASGNISQYTHYLYDAGGNRVKKLSKKQNGDYESTTYIDSIFEYFTDGTDEQNTLHIMDDSSRIATQRIGYAFGDTTPATKYIIADHLGNSTIQVSSTGANISQEEYYPFGETSFGSYAKKRYKYNGKEKDSESGLYYYGARYYSAWTCRFVSVDPWKEKYLWQSSYAYFKNSPITISDFQGLGGDPELNDDTGTATITAQVHFIQDPSVSDEEFEEYIEYYTNNLETVFNNNNTYQKGDQIYQVVLNVSYSIINSESDVVNADSSDNFITVRAGGGVSNAEKGGTHASMNINDGGNTAAHEFLHLLGLDDRYQFAQSALRSGEVPSANFEILQMPRGQVNEPVGYVPQDNIMGNSAVDGMTNLQWDYIFENKIENTNPVTIFYRGLFKGSDILGVVNYEIVDSNNVPMPKDEYFGYANEDFSITDNGSYFRVDGKQTSFGQTVLGYFGNNRGTVEKQRISFDNFMTPYRR